jgi:hypothetical protein
VVLASLGVVVGTVTIVLLVSLASGVRRQVNNPVQSTGLLEGPHRGTNSL